MSTITDTTARILVPVPVTSSMIGAGSTLPEPATAYGEVAWVSGASYAIDAEVTHIGNIYKCVKAHTGITVTPPNDAVNWLRTGPTLRMAPFDDYTATAARAAGTLTYVISPGFIDGIKLYKPAGAAYSITVKDAPSGTVIASKSGDLYEQAAGLYELLFSPLPTIEQIGLDEIPLSPTTEVTISITNGASGTCGIGDIKLGGWRVLKGGANDFGGVTYGASGQRKTYTTRKYNADGTYSTIKRGTYNTIRCTLELDASQSMYLTATLGEIIDIAVPFEATNHPDYQFLSTLGFVSASLSAADYGLTKADFDIQGNI